MQGTRGSGLRGEKTGTRNLVLRLFCAAIASADHPPDGARLAFVNSAVRLTKMSASTLEVSFRPVRVGFCVANGDINALCTVFDFAATVWGGTYCPIIVPEDPVFGANLIRRFQPDILFAVSTDTVTKSFVREHHALRWPFFDDTFFESSGLPRILSIEHPLRLVQSAGRHNQYEFEMRRYTWSEEDPLALWFQAAHGRYMITEQHYVGDFSEMYNLLTHCSAE